jgi:hypothetical protein
VLDMSGVWLSNGGWFKKSATSSDNVVCTFQADDSSDACGKVMPHHVSNMWKHLATHDFTKEKAQARLAAAAKGGMRSYTTQVKRPPLSLDQQAEYVTLLSVALANQGMSLYAFDKRDDKHVAVIGDDGESTYAEFPRFTLHSCLRHCDQSPEISANGSSGSVAHGTSGYECAI